MARYLGVDAGGTRTRLVVIDEAGRELARGEGGPGNLRRAGARGLASALRKARSGAGLDRPCDAAFLGVAGAASAEERETVRELGLALGLAASGRIEADHDLRVAHAGAFGSAPGIVVIAGTGSSAYGRDGAGRALRSGVWDHAPDDPGSGFDLGRHLLAAFSRAAPGAPERVPLEELLRVHLAPDAFARFFDGQPLARDEVARLAPAVLAAAERGEPTAKGALLTGVRQLCTCVRYVHAELGERAAEVALTGGLTSSKTWSDAFAAALGRILPEARLVASRSEPVLGAARLAAALP
jgi:N-acetylglucosamine kinase-like BadF-type ATPase